MRSFPFVFLASIFFAHATGTWAQIRAEVHLDKDHYLAGEPVFLIWEYTNVGSAEIPFDRFNPYCPEPLGVDAPSLPFAQPTVFPFPHDGIINCESFRAALKPGEIYETKFLLNHRFDLSKPGEYTLTVPLGTGIYNPSKPSMPGGYFGTKQLSLILRPSSDAELREAYQPYFDALKSGPSDGAREAIRVLADSGAKFAETDLLRFSSDPRNGSDIQELADEGLLRLKTPTACARLAELANHPELHWQQAAIDRLGQCGDPSYMLFLFQLGDRDRDVRDFAISAAAEAGGDAAVDRILLDSSLDREKLFYALGRTGSERAAKAIIDALPSLHEGNSQFAALRSLTTLTHRESRKKDFESQVRDWEEWWADSRVKEIYKPRDWHVPLMPLN